MQKKSRIWRRGLCACAAALSLAAFPAAAHAQDSASRPTHAGSTPWPANPDWQQYVEGPSTPNVTPVAVTRTTGDDTTAAALVAGGTGGATLTMTSGGTAPAIVLDYGKDIGGFPYFNVTAESGSPTLRAEYSEGEQFLGTWGDEGGAFNAGDPVRADSYTVTAPGTITNTYIQGGERFEEITLTSPGSVTLSTAGIQFSAYRATPSDYQGYFDSSSDQLNKIWYAGAYTDQLDMLPAGEATGDWLVSNGSMTASGGDEGLFDTGSTWTDYTMSYQTEVLDDQVGWVVRAQSPGNEYLFILNDSTDYFGTPDSLQELSVSGGTYHLIATVPLPFTLAADTWHTVTSAVSGTTVTTSVDGQEIGSIDSANFYPGTPSFTSGTIGFRENGSESAEFKDLTVTDSSGATLYSNALSAPSDLSDFTVPGVNQLPVILDGGKRDRNVWIGDINVEGPAVYDSLGTNGDAYIKNSILLLGSYQLSSGFVTGCLAPQTPVNTGPLIPGTTACYSASYSMYFADDLADYYQATGDLAFAKQEFPIVQRELAWNASLVNAQGLLATDDTDGLDWDWYDGEKTGAVTEYNALYYRDLTDGAYLAQQTGNTALATQYTNQAAALRTAINANLFNTSTGVYDVSTALRGTAAQDANSDAVLYGVAPAAAVPGILAKLQSTLWGAHGPVPFSSDTTGYKTTVSPFVSGYELRARLAAGDTSDALQLLSDVWGQMVTPGPDYTGALWENVNPDGTIPLNTTSLAHGWSSTPTSALTDYVLGARPVGAGYATWIVQPQPGSLSWAEGQVPTAYGPLTVKWGRANGRAFDMEVSAPSGTSGTIAVPVSGGNTEVTVNGVRVWDHGCFRAGAEVTSAHSDGSYVYLSVSQAGDYRVTAK